MILIIWAWSDELTTETEILDHFAGFGCESEVASAPAGGADAKIETFGEDGLRREDRKDNQKQSY